MLKKLVNECKLTLQITTEGPLLVKSGYATPHGPDMTPVLTYRNGTEQVFIPGSSLKGVFRSHLEKVIRSLNNTENAVCMPFGESSCVARNHFQERHDDLKKKGKALENATVYRESCPACRLFGSTFFIGRIAVSDAYLPSAENTVVTQFTENRDGVGIDRLSGGAFDGALFNMLVVKAGVNFETEVYLRNFEVWQLGGLMLILQDLEDSLIRIGSGRSRGLGNVKGTVTHVDIQYLQPTIQGKPTNEIWGLGKFLNGEHQQYGTSSDDLLKVAVAPTEEMRGIRLIQRFSGNSFNELKKTSMNVFVQKIQQWHVN